MVVFQYSSTFPYSWNNFCCFRIPIYGHEETQIISRKKDTKFVYEMTCLFTNVGVYDISSIHSPNRFSHECYSRVMGFLLIFVLVSQLQGPYWAIDPRWNRRSLSLPRRCKFRLCSPCLFWQCTLPVSPIFICIDWLLTHALRLLPQIEMIYKIIQHMAANDRALIAEGSCGSPCSVKVYLGECNVDEDMQAA